VLLIPSEVYLVAVGCRLVLDPGIVINNVDNISLNPKQRIITNIFTAIIGYRQSLLPLNGVSIPFAIMTLWRSCG